MSATNTRNDRRGGFATPGSLGEGATLDIAAVLPVLLADMFALYVKTKNFHRHVSGPHFVTII